MRRFLLSLILLTVLTFLPAEAGMLTIEPEVYGVKFRENGVVFPINNNTGKTMETVYGWVYGYNKEEPRKYELVNNPHIAALRITSGPHINGKKALYLFTVPKYHLKRERYGVMIYNSAITFSK